MIIFLAVVLVWIVSFFIWAKALKNKKKNILFYSINSVLLYIALLLGTFCYNKYLDFKLNQFDLDKDGTFSISEQTAEQKKFMALNINDLNRNYIFVTGLFIAIGSSLLLFVIIQISHVIHNRKNIKMIR